MKAILESYKTLYTQILEELAKNGLTEKERRTLIEMLYNTNINITQAKNTLNNKQ